MFFTLTLPNKVHLETKPKKLKHFFFAFQQSSFTWNLSQVCPQNLWCSVPLSPQQGDYTHGSSETSVHPSRGTLEMSLNSPWVSPPSLLSCFYQLTPIQIIAASKIPSIACPLPARLLREVCVLSFLLHFHSLCHASPSPPVCSATVPLKGLSALSEWLALSSSSLHKCPGDFPPSEVPLWPQNTPLWSCLPLPLFPSH